MQTSNIVVHKPFKIITKEFHESSIVYPVVFFFSASTIYLGGIIGLGMIRETLVKTILAVPMTLSVAKLFVIGHDACHGSFIPNRRLNRIVAASALTMSFHFPGAWRFWHNAVHHVFTNDLTKDFVWRPLSRWEYQRASRLRRWRERIYRHHSGIGLGLYYFIEILVPRMLTISYNVKPFRRRVSRSGLFGFYTFHSVIVAWLVGASILEGNPVEMGVIAVNLFVGVVLPVVSICYVIGFVVYFNHTHPEIKWRMSAVGAGFVERQTSATVYMKFQGISEFLLPSGVMGHVAHHLDTKIPERKLPQAQERLILESTVPIKIEMWSWVVQCRIMKSCKLYEPIEGIWTGFNGAAS
jgi:acyl-lipid omega-6 desaturase (Delta-12 desaturase)